IRQNLDALTTTALYPIRVDLLSSLQPVATLRTPMVFLTQEPKLPVALTISWTLWEPLQMLPDGTLGPGPIEADIAAGGRLDRTVQAIAKGPAAVAVAISPVLPEELRLMDGGYRVRAGSRATTVARAGAGAAAAAAMPDAFWGVGARRRAAI